MQPIEIPEFPILRGEEAVKALYDFISELEEQKGEELTEKQTKALIKLARGLISSIEAETRLGTSDKDIKGMRFVTQLKKHLGNIFQDQLEQTKNSRLWK